ncbi:uncharacterized protein LOC127729952 [Mytilus californianus]|uniref:uncharacterized protein LOC127729952 n=1 Tax=Mytilus californianus TaxID=6549 RepID=UPI002245E4C9|nr:uncharacterized protein LOC127729952 [Mytilus californianus]
MKYCTCFVVLILSLCVAGLYAKKQHMASFNFDQFCPERPTRCDYWCKFFGFDRGVCEGNWNVECWCYWDGPKPSLQGKSRIANEK